MRYVVIFERSDTGYGAYAPDVPGCIATGRTLEEAAQRFAEALRRHLEIMREYGEPIPEPTSSADVIEVDVT